MAFNPASMMKMMTLKNKFEKNHPKFFAYFKAVFSKPIEQGTIVEITVTRPGEEPLTTNIVINQEDLELFNELRTLA